MFVGLLLVVMAGSMIFLHQGREAYLSEGIHLDGQWRGELCLPEKSKQAPGVAKDLVLVNILEV